MAADLTTAAGVIAALLTVVGVLWRDHQRADREDREQRDRALSALEASLDGNKRLAAAWEARNRRDEGRARRTDGR